MNTNNIKRLSLGGKEVKSIKIGGKIAWQGFPEYTIGGTKYAPETFPQWHTITGNTNINFSNFDNSSYKLTAYIIGGGGAGGRAHGRVCPGWEDGDSYSQAGAGGEGGEVVTAIPSIVENTNYNIVIGSGGTVGSFEVKADPEFVAPSGDTPHRWSNASKGGNGGNSSAFGYTAKGGNGADTKSGDYNYTDQIPGGSGNNGADGGIGARSYFVGNCWVYPDEGTPTPPDFHVLEGGVGKTGTEVNGAIYGSGGSSGGLQMEFLWINWQWGAPVRSGHYNEPSAPSNAAGHGNYGSGGNGESLFNYHGALGSSYQLDGELYSLGNYENGTQGAVIIKIEER